MSLGQILAIVQARWIVVVLSFIAVLSGAIAYALTRPVTYTATASMIIDAKPDPISSMFGGGTSPSVLNTQLEIIRSERVAQRVVRNLKLADLADLRTQWEKTSKGVVSIEVWLGEMIRAGLDVNFARVGSNVIYISYRGSDPRFAASVANAYIQAYMETSIELRVDPAKQYNSFFDDKVKEARDALEKAQLRLSGFQQEKGIIGTDDRMNIELNQLNQMSQELVALRNILSDSNTRNIQAQQDPSRMPEVLGNPTIAGLKAELVRTETRLLEISSRLGENHPQVQDARVAVADLRARIAAEIKVVTEAVGITAKLNQTREAELRAAVDAQRIKVLQLKEVRDEGGMLARDVENAQRSYDQVLNRYNQTNLESQNRQSNSIVLSQASLPTAPSNPKLVAMVVMGIGGGLGVGVVLALAIEQLNRRIRTGADVTVLLGLPVIGYMPTPTMGRRALQQLAQVQQRVISGRVLPANDKV